MLSMGRPLQPAIILDIHSILTDDDKVFFRKQREERFGAQLEEVRRARQACVVRGASQDAQSAGFGAAVRAGPLLLGPGRLCTLCARAPACPRAAGCTAGSAAAAA